MIAWLIIIGLSLFILYNKFNKHRKIFIKLDDKEKIYANTKTMKIFFLEYIPPIPIYVVHIPEHDLWYEVCKIPFLNIFCSWHSRDVQYKIKGEYWNKEKIIDYWLELQSKEKQNGS